MLVMRAMFVCVCIYVCMCMCEYLHYFVLYFVLICVSSSLIYDAEYTSLWSNLFGGQIFSVVKSFRWSNLFGAQIFSVVKSFRCHFETLGSVCMYASMYVFVCV
jgi:hypothetical protein